MYRHACPRSSCCVTVHIGHSCVRQSVQAVGFAQCSADQDVQFDAKAVFLVQVSLAKVSCGMTSESGSAYDGCDSSVHLASANMAYRMTGQTGSLCYMAPEVGRLSTTSAPPLAANLAARAEDQVP